MTLYNIDIPELNTALLKEVLSLKDADNYNFFFNALGFGFQAYIDKSKEAPRLVLFSEFGRIPFSAENPEQRKHALTILQHTHLSLRHPTIRYGISKGAKVFMLARVSLDDNPTLDTVINRIVHAIMESLPVLSLLRSFAPLVLKN